jgi:hypothetical protein
MTSVCVRETNTHVTGKKNDISNNIPSDMRASGLILGLLSLGNLILGLMTVGQVETLDILPAESLASLAAPGCAATAPPNSNRRLVLWLLPLPISKKTRAVQPNAA